MDIHHLPAYELADKIKNKEISSLELTQHFIDRIEKYDDKINAVVVRTFEDAIEAAKKADDAISKKDSRTGNQETVSFGYSSLTCL